eukprot:768475-Hanusia_phi.AAC.11
MKSSSLSMLPYPTIFIDRCEVVSVNFITIKPSRPHDQSSPVAGAQAIAHAGPWVRSKTYPVIFDIE